MQCAKQFVHGGIIERNRPPGAASGQCDGVVLRQSEQRNRNLLRQLTGCMPQLGERPLRVQGSAVQRCEPIRFARFEDPEIGQPDLLFLR